MQICPRHLHIRQRRSPGSGLGFVVAGLATLLCFAWAGAASAASTRISFDFTANSFISILGGVIVTPPDGTMDTGTARLDVEATDETTFVPGGTATLDLLNFAGSVSKNVGGVADVSGPYSGTQVGSLAGNVNLALDAASFGSDLMLDLNVVFGCTGSGCGTLGFPISEIGIVPLSLGSLPISNLGTLGGATIQTIVPVSLDGVQGVLNLFGVEVSRVFIPEPGTFATLALGLMTLAAVHPSRRS